MPFTFSLSPLLFFPLNIFFPYFLWFHFEIFLALNSILKYFHRLLMMTYWNFHSRWEIFCCFLKKEIHYCLWLWLFDLRHNNVQTFSPHLLAKDQRTSGSTKLLVCKSRRINKKALDAEAGSNQRLLESYWAKHVYLIRT